MLTPGLTTQIWWMVLMGLYKSAALEILGLLPLLRLAPLLRWC